MEIEKQCIVTKVYRNVKSNFFRIKFHVANTIENHRKFETCSIQLVSQFRLIITEKQMSLRVEHK